MKAINKNSYLYVEHYDHTKEKEGAVEEHDANIDGCKICITNYYTLKRVDLVIK